MNNAEVLITFKGDATGVNSATKSVEKSFENLQKTGALALAGIGLAMDKMATNILGTGIAYNAQIETYLTRLETLTGSAEEANKVLETIKQDALKTPFEVSSLTQAESLLLATGLSAEQARDDILALGNAVSASGGGNAELQRMAVNLQQIKNVGKASALDIKQFAYAGIDIYGLLADSMGITREEASKMDITYDMLSEALQKASSEGGKYYKAMEKQSKTYNGAMSNLNESIQVLKGEIAKDLFNALKKVIPVINKFVDWLTKNHKIVKAIAIPLLVFLNTVMGFMAIQKVITVIKALNAALIANPALAVVAGILALIAVLIYLYDNCKAFRTFVDNTFKIFKTLFEEQLRIITNVIKGIWNVIKWLWDGIITVGKFILGLPGKIFNIGKNIITSLKEGVVNTWNSFTQKIGEYVQWIIDKFNIWDDMVKVGEDLINGIKEGVKNVWGGFKNWISKKADDIVGFFKNPLGIHSPSTVMADTIGKNMVLGVEVGFGKELPNLQKQINSSFNLSPTLSGTANTHLSPQVNVVVNNNMKTDPLGQVVNKVKTFSGGAKNDYNYGYGG